MHIYNIRNFTRITKFYKSIATNPRELHACAQVGAQARAYDASANAGTQGRTHDAGKGAGALSHVTNHHVTHHQIALHPC